MTTHSRVLAWRIPGTEEPGGLPSMGSQRVGHDCSDLAAAAAAAAACHVLWPNLGQPSCFNTSSRDCHAFCKGCSFSLGSGGASQAISTELTHSLQHNVNRTCKFVILRNH